jgi:hypothetical protein
MTPRRLAAAFLLIVSVLVGVAALRPNHAPTPGPRAAAHAAPTRRSAVQAAVSALYALTIPAITDRTRFEDAVRKLAAPGSRRQLELTFGSHDPSLVTAFRARPSILRGAPVGYRVERFSRTAASVAIWTVTIAASPRFPATAQWRTLVVDLAWTPNGWRVAGGDGSGGPDPSTPLRELVSESSRFRSFVDAP